MKQLVTVVSRRQVQAVLLSSATVILIRFNVVMIHFQTLVQLTVTKPSQDSRLQDLRIFVPEL